MKVQSCIGGQSKRRLRQRLVLGLSAQCRSHQLGIVGDDCPGHIGRVLGKLEHRHATRVPSASTPALAQLASIVVDDVEATGSHVLYGKFVLNNAPQLFLGRRVGQCTCAETACEPL